MASVYKLPFWIIMSILAVICALVFTPGLFMLAYGHTLTDWPVKLTVSSLLLHSVKSTITFIFVVLAVMWYADLAFPAIMRLFGALLNRVEIAK